jgi:hypothetical protein
LLLLGLSWPLRAGAEPNDLVSLDWSAPAECPRVEEVQARIRKLAGSLTSKAKPRANATITRKEEGGLHLRLAMQSENSTGERNIDGKSCNDLAGAAAVALVLLLQSGDASAQAELRADAPLDDEARRSERARAEQARAEQARAEQAKSSAAANSQSAAAEASEDLDDSRPRRFLVQLPGVALGVGPVPGVSWGVAGAAGVSLERWRLLAGATLWRKRQASASDGFEQYGADISHVTGQLLACRAVVASRFEVAPCATVSVQHVSARGTGAHIAPRTARATWLAVGVAAQARARVSSWFSLALGLGGELETARPRLSLESLGKVEQLLPVAANFTLSTEWHF